MKVTLTHDGKSVELDLTAEQMAALGLKEEKKKTGYERNNHFYYATGIDGIIQACEASSVYDHYYECANYYTDEKLAEANARADKLMRQLRRFAAENGGIPSVEDWKKSHETNKYEIYYSYRTGRFEVNELWTSRTIGSPCFATQKAAKDAIEKFHNELIWYFTEYEAMLR